LEGRFPSLDATVEHQFQGQMVKGQGYRRVGAYRVG